MAIERMYEAMKLAMERDEFSGHKLKTASQQSIYENCEPYFWTAEYFEGWKEQGQAAGTKFIRIDLHLKYSRWDELQYSIIHPGKGMKFSNKLRAMGNFKCRDRIWSRAYYFPWDDEVQDYEALAVEVLRTILHEVQSILDLAERDFGGLGAYLIANPQLNPRLSALACIEEQNYAKAVEILEQAGRLGENLLVRAETEEQLSRLQKRYPTESSQTFLRDFGDIYIDYCKAMEQGLSWTADLAAYSLPLKEESMKQINDYIQYIEPSQVPLSAAVYIIKGEQNHYIFDVGRDKENVELLSQFDNKVIVLSHYHGDHCDNIHQLDYKQLYVGDLCAGQIGKGHVVQDMLKLHDGVELCIRHCPSVHVGGSLILTVNNEYCLLGDVHLHRATFDSNTAWRMLAVLKRVKCKYFLLAHGEELMVEKERLIAQLEEEFR